MPTNNFKLFDQNKANLLSDTEYANATQRLNGVQTGVASSQLNNKFAYQVSLVAYAIAQIMNQNGLDASDTLSVSAFVGNLGGALLQKVADKASSAEAAAGVLTNKYISPATMKAAALLLSGGVMTGTLDMNNNQIINLPTPTSSSEPATKGYVDGNALKVDVFYQNSFSSISSNGVALGFKMESLLSFMKEHDLIYIEIIGASSNGGRLVFLPFEDIDNLRDGLYIELALQESTNENYYYKLYLSYGISEYDTALYILNQANYINTNWNYEFHLIPRGSLNVTNVNFKIKGVKL